MAEANHHHFLLFIIYSWVATAYAFWLARHPYVHCLGDPDVTAALAHNSTNPLVESLSADHPCATWTEVKPRLYYIAVGSFALLSAFLTLVLYLIATDQTTIEFITFSSPRRRREDLLAHYRVRGLGHHLQRILGPAAYWWRYLLPLPQLHSSIPRHVPGGSTSR